MRAMLHQSDKRNLARMEALYRRALEASQSLCKAEEDESVGSDRCEEKRLQLIDCYAQLGEMMHIFTRDEPNIRIYSFQTPRVAHGEVSRLIAKLRNQHTPYNEFIYYIQRAYELLFNLAFANPAGHRKRHLIVRTPVDIPVPNYAVHKIPDIDEHLGNSVMCVLLRGALLPSMIMSKEIEEYSSSGYVTPFALFSINRRETPSASGHNISYAFDLDRSYFQADHLHGSDLFFADPMNATGGSVITIMNYLNHIGLKPRSVKFFNVICAFEGALRVVRAIEGACVYTLWMDPALNDMAYIMPGLGDAGDRINGVDSMHNPRGIVQLIADYGATIANLYRSQVRKIEATVLGR